MHNINYGDDFTAWIFFLLLWWQSCLCLFIVDSGLEVLPAKLHRLDSSQLHPKIFEPVALDTGYLAFPWGQLGPGALPGLPGSARHLQVTQQVITSAQSECVNCI